jgi:CheY-like chemotaxis protein
VLGDASSLARGTGDRGRGGSHGAPHRERHGMRHGCRDSRALFEPFFTTEERGKGTGLGPRSSTASWISAAAACGWRATRAGRECSCVFHPRAALPQARAAHGGPARIGSVLLVEDGSGARAGAGDARDGGLSRARRLERAEALSWAENPAHSFDILVSDVVMPRMNGGEAERLRHMRPHARVLFVSGYPDDASCATACAKAALPSCKSPSPTDAHREAARVLDSLSAAPLSADRLGLA